MKAKKGMLFLVALFCFTGGMNQIEAATHEISVSGMYRLQAEEKMDYGKSIALREAKRRVADQVAQLLEYNSTSREGKLTDDEIESLSASFFRLASVRYEMSDGNIITAYVDAVYDDADNEILVRRLEQIEQERKNQRLKHDISILKQENNQIRRRADLSRANQYNELVEPLQGAKEITANFYEFAKWLPKEEPIYTFDTSEKKYVIHLLGYTTNPAVDYVSAGGVARPHRSPLIVARVGVLIPNHYGAYSLDPQYLRIYAVDLENRTWQVYSSYNVDEYSNIVSVGTSPVTACSYHVEEKAWNAIMRVLPADLVSGVRSLNQDDMRD